MIEVQGIWGINHNDSVHLLSHQSVEMAFISKYRRTHPVWLEGTGAPMDGKRRTLAGGAVHGKTLSPMTIMYLIYNAITYLSNYATREARGWRFWCAQFRWNIGERYVIFHSVSGEYYEEFPPDLGGMVDRVGKYTKAVSLAYESVSHR